LLINKKIVENKNKWIFFIKVKSACHITKITKIHGQRVMSVFLLSQVVSGSKAKESSYYRDEI